MRKSLHVCLAAGLGMALLSTAVFGEEVTGQEQVLETQEVTNEENGAEAGEEVAASIDYMALVNKLHPLPEGWEDALETVHTTNSPGG